MDFVVQHYVDGSRESFLDAGFDGYLSKPIDMAVLTKEIRQLLD